jgi:hypothetical protein
MGDNSHPESPPTSPLSPTRRLGFGVVSSLPLGHTHNAVDALFNQDRAKPVNRLVCYSSDEDSERDDDNDAKEMPGLYVFDSEEDEDLESIYPSTGMPGQSALPSSLRSPVSLSSRAEPASPITPSNQLIRSDSNSSTSSSSLSGNKRACNDYAGKAKGVWKRQVCPGGFVKLTSISPDKTEVLVSELREKKAYKNLDSNEILKVLSPTSCRCVKQCHGKFTTATIRQCRLKLFVSSVTDECSLIVHLSKILLSMVGEHANLIKSRIQYSIEGTPVCVMFYIKAYGISQDKLYAASKLALNGGADLYLHGNQLAQNRPVIKPLQSDVCYNFWHHFFDENCQRPTKFVRLFPVNKSYLFIYDYYFKSWFEKQCPSNETNCDDVEHIALPSLSTFQRARKHKDFKDVKKRAKHYHCRCSTCATLTTRRLRGFLDPSQQEAWKLELKAHEAAAKGWHQLEEATKARAKATPHEVLYITYDDTNSLGLPKLTNRDLKNLVPPTAFYIYIYSLCSIFVIMNELTIVNYRQICIN